MYYAVPRRFVTLRLDIEPRGRVGAPVFFGLRSGKDPGKWDERRIEPDQISGRRIFLHTVGVPLESSEVQLRVRTESSVPVHVHSLMATDACALRGYEPQRPVGRGLWLYRNPGALPRAYAVSSVVPVASIEEAREILLNDDRLDPARTALVQGAPPISAQLSRGEVTGERFGAQTVEIEVQSFEGPTFLVVNDRFDPGWKATIDGRPAPIYRTNGLVRGMSIPRGRHVVRMRYRAAASVYLGVLLAVLGLVFAMFISPAVDRRLFAGNPGE
jgi:hypothetical protein